MHKLIVSLPLNRDFEGELRLEAENGRVLAGPFPVCGRADREAARRHGNPTGQATLPFGDTPLGRYRIAGIQATGRKTSLPVEHFGPHEVVVLTPVAGDAALADANGRFCILIQGGTMGAGRRLRPTNGSLRLADKDQKALIRALRKYRPPCTCECVADTAADGGRMVAKNAPFETLDPPLPVSAVNPTMTAAAGFERGQFSPEGSRIRRFAAPSFRMAAADSGGGGGGTGSGGGYDSRNSFSSVDTAVINQNELFVPKVYADSKGFPTVGYGVNLNAQSVESLQAAGVPQSIIDQVEPLLGMSADDYKTWSQDNSLTLSDADAQTLSTAVQNQYFNATGEAFDNKTTLGVTFSDLPTEAQTAICDLWYNMGNLSSAAKCFWRQVYSGQWQEAIDNLTSKTTPFSSSDDRLNERAAADGQLLQNALNAGTLPKPKS